MKVTTEQTNARRWRAVTQIRDVTLSALGDTEGEALDDLVWQIDHLRLPARNTYTYDIETRTLTKENNDD